jgi:hypothetical protein
LAITHAQEDAALLEKSFSDDLHLNFDETSAMSAVPDFNHRLVLHCLITYLYADLPCCKPLDAP